MVELALRTDLISSFLGLVANRKENRERECKKIMTSLKFSYSLNSNCINWVWTKHLLNYRNECRQFQLRWFKQNCFPENNSRNETNFHNNYKIMIEYFRIWVINLPIAHLNIWRLFPLDTKHFRFLWLFWIYTNRETVTSLQAFQRGDELNK